jgi:predicted nucleic acid-binding protein
MVFLDANVPMYLVGADHRNRTAAAAILQRLALEGRKLVTDVEVYQEILHRYTAIRRTDAIQPAFDTLSELVDEVFPLSLELVHAAQAIVLGYPGLSARDAVHIATMQSRSVKEVLSFDAGFDRVPGLTRIFE